MRKTNTIISLVCGIQKNNTNESIYKKKQTHRHRKQNFGYQRGKKGTVNEEHGYQRGKKEAVNEEHGVNRHKLPYMEEVSNKGLPYAQGL